MAAWLPADVVLCTPYGEEARKLKLVNDVQRHLGYERVHARWIHAALYIGDGLVVNVTSADPDYGDKVVLKHVTDFVLDANFRVRRNSGLLAAHRTAIAERGRDLSNENLRYSPRKAFSFAVRALGLRGDRVLSAPKLFDGVVCSDIVTLAYSRGLRKRPPFMSRTGTTVLPATLSQSDWFDDLDLSWCSIPVGL